MENLTSEKYRFGVCFFFKGQQNRSNEQQFFLYQQ